MQIKVDTVEEYIDQIPEERKEVIQKLRKVLSENLPEGFREEMSYGMIGYVVPHEIYPKGYHCKPKLPLPFINVASQKNFVALYHMNLYANESLMEWFITEYPKHSKVKLDIGKSCMRFKKLDQIPYELIGELAQKITVEEWIKTYEETFGIA
jgi:uncharacterized protein YdhG (YjbR/CyaY superfamily)